MKILKRIGFGALLLIGGVIALFLLVWAVLAVMRPILYGDYLGQREKVCEIPDLNDGFVPQGIAYSDDVNSYIITGYCENDIKLYISHEGEAKEIIPVDADGKTLSGHAGGVTCTKDRVYIADSGELIIFTLSELAAAKDGDKVASIGSFEVDNSASFCFSDDEYIYVGEFYRAENYEIDMSHAYTTPSGAENRAIVSCYPLDAEGRIADEYPLYSISIPELVQGFAVYNGKIILSRSYGLNSSSIDYHGEMKDSGETIDVSGKAVPLYYLDGTTLEKTLTAPAFSEDLCIVDGKLVVPFESACNKYIVGKLFGAKYAVALPIE